MVLVRTGMMLGDLLSHQAAPSRLRVASMACHVPDDCLFPGACSAWQPLRHWVHLALNHLCVACRHAPGAGKRAAGAPHCRLPPGSAQPPGAAVRAALRTWSLVAPQHVFAAEQSHCLICCRLGMVHKSGKIRDGCILIHLTMFAVNCVWCCRTPL